MSATFVTNNVNTLGMKLRRLAVNSMYNNPVYRPGVLPNESWRTSGSFSAGAIVNSNGNMYQCYQGGVSINGGSLSGASGVVPILDNSCIWAYLGGTPALTTGVDVPSFSFFNGTPGGTLTQYVSGGTDTSLRQLSPEGGNYYLWDGNLIRMPSVSTGINQTGNIFNGAGGTIGSSATRNRLSFITDAPKFAFTTAYPQQCRMFVDSIPLWNGNMTIGSGAGICGMTIDYTGGGNRKHRLVTIELAGSAGIGGVYVDTNSSVEKPYYPDYIKAVFIGDSYLSGASSLPVNVAGFWPHIAGNLLGWSDVVSSGLGGTGLVTDGSNWRYGSRISYDVLGQNVPLGGNTQLGTFINPNVVVICGSVNDVGVAGIGAAAASVYSTIRGSLPNALIIFVGIVANSLNNAATTATSEKAMFDGLPTGDPLLALMPISDTTRISPTWFSGQGASGYGGTAVSGPGVNTVYIGGDKVHPTDWGHTYLAHRFAQYFRNVILPTLVV